MIARRSALRRIAWVVAPLASLALVALLLFVHHGSTPETCRLVVLRERNGQTERLMNEVRVRKGDRLRVEVAIDRARAITAGVLERSGTWIPLVSPATLEAGPHDSEVSALFDENPTSGWILAGSPDAVQRARSTHLFGEVRMLPLESDASF